MLRSQPLSLDPGIRLRAAPWVSPTGHPTMYIAGHFDGTPCVLREFFISYDLLLQIVEAQTAGAADRTDQYMASM